MDAPTGGAGGRTVEFPREPDEGRVSFTWCRFANQIKGFRSLNGRVTYDHCFFDGRDLSSAPKLTKEFSKEYMDLGFGHRIPNIGNTTHMHELLLPGMRNPER